MTKPGTPTQRAILAEQLRYLRKWTAQRGSAATLAEQWGLIRGLSVGWEIRVPFSTYLWATRRIRLARS